MRQTRGFAVQVAQMKSIDSNYDSNSNSSSKRWRVSSCWFLAISHNIRLATISFATIIVKFDADLDLHLRAIDHDLDDLEMQSVRYKPEGLETLCRNTKFTKKELQIMYRGFKQVRIQSELVQI